MGNVLLQQGWQGMLVAFLMSSSSSDVPAPDSGDVAAIDSLRSNYAALKAEVAKVIIGQDAVIEQMLISILAKGHALLMGVPGLAKTTMVHALADVMSLSFSRIQFTPDLMPSDITGTDILQETDQPGKRAFEFVKGPVFANIVLADEINRTPPKTQSALLEAMQEHKVTASGKSLPLPAPFFVLATQNPIEQEGTYSLPEAQLDRFMFFINVEYPSYEEELRIAEETTSGKSETLSKLIDAEKVMEYQSLVQRIPVPEHVFEFATKLVRATRPDSPDAKEWLKRWVSWGAGPRAVQYLIRGARAHALLHGNYLVGTDDIEAVALPVLTHRILCNFQAQSEGVGSMDVIKRLIEETHEEGKHG